MSGSRHSESNELSLDAIDDRWTMAGGSAPPETDPDPLTEAAVPRAEAASGEWLEEVEDWGDDPGPLEEPHGNAGIAALLDSPPSSEEQPSAVDSGFLDEPSVATSPLTADAAISESIPEPLRLPPEIPQGLPGGAPSDSPAMPHPLEPAAKGRFKLTRSALAAALVVALGGVGVVIGIAVGSSSSPSDAVAAPGGPGVSADHGGEGERSARASLLERARRGDAEAIERIEAKPQEQRERGEILALAAGKVEQERQAARALRERLAADPGLIEDTQVLRDLQRMAGGQLTAVDGLAAMAELPGALSADLIYEVWTGVAERTAATRLAEQLVYTDEILAKASPALKVALDLRRTEECEPHLEILSRAIEHGDRRSFHLLGKRAQTFGCGPAKKDDCFQCLRDGDDLERAMQAVRSRPAPKW